MRKKFFLAILILAVGTAQAQRTTNSTSYKTALGVKVWDGAGISLKHFFNKNAGELIGYFYRHGFRLTGLYEVHGPITGAPGLKWYIGPGMHVGFYDGYYHHGNRYYYHDHDAVVGIDGVLGLDYKFRGAPINVSLDWQPSFEFADGHGFSGSWGGLGIRYTF
ncbi:hypothetical protein OCK74_23275 [Chitinophagaceae bacterium LB-8]|uniref:Outer membrane protein beta-barrel domain-containing protein n=1 Tax=Paraflavisolibacter caeni TaxID=2982496 RepID=A0A9X2Y0E1_9BACT|nr:hypothetical protein [Paraflavisolibacter caeni]MCU7552062.1 hypothetical protein [Paraflavisolibacter caeni]